MITKTINGQGYAFFSLRKNTDEKLRCALGTFCTLSNSAAMMYACRHFFRGKYKHVMVKKVVIDTNGRLTYEELGWLPEVAMTLITANNKNS